MKNATAGALFTFAVNRRDEAPGRGPRAWPALPSPAGGRGNWTVLAYVYICEVLDSGFIFAQE